MIAGESKAQGIDTTLFVSAPILSCPTDSSIVIRTVPKTGMSVFYEYGTAPGVYSTQTAAAQTVADVPVKTIISNLLPATRYYYRLNYKLNGTTQWINCAEYTFITQRARGSSFCFTIRGDSHLYDKKGNGPLMKITMENINADRPDFDFEMGDTFGDDRNPSAISQQDMMRLHLNYLKYLGVTGHSAPFYFCIGNHEGESGYWLLQTPPNNLAVWGTLARKYYYTLPSPSGFYKGNAVPEGYGMGLPENYYSWEWGDALFVVLDCYRYSAANSSAGGWDWTIGDGQYQWFKQTLESSSARYKFVFAHQVLGYGRGGIVNATKFEWGGYSNNGSWDFTANRPGWPVPLHQLMKANGVNILFHGHDHLFAKEVLDDIIYQEVPMPSDSTYMIGWLANSDAYSGDILSGSGHLKVTVSPGNAKVEYIAAYLPADTNGTHINGKAVYSYSVNTAASAVEENTEFTPGFRLEQNYPNPFNTETLIKYSVPEIVNANLSVYNIFGEEISNLVNGNINPGQHESVLNAADLPPGVYFCRFKSSKFDKTIKISLIK